jgi:hypothetical protein
MHKHVLLALGVLLTFGIPLRSQDAGSRDPLAGALPYLSPVQRLELKTDFVAALKKDSALSAEWQQLLVDTGTPAVDPAEMEAIKARILAFEVKVRAVMAKDDSNVGAIVDQIDRHMPMLHPELVGK